MDIKEIKSTEVSEMYDFLEGLQDYGHIYHYPPEKLDEPFKKIMEGIDEIQQLMKDSFEILVDLFPIEKIWLIKDKNAIIGELQEVLTECNKQNVKWHWV